MTFRVTHVTTYRYAADVTASYGQLHLLPRTTESQVCRRAEVAIEPVPDDLREHVDFFGNRATYFSVLTPHQQLRVTTTSLVEVIPRPTSLLTTDPPWETVRDALPADRSPGGLDARQHVLESPLVAVSPELRAYADASFTAGRGFVDATLDLVRRIHHDFEYKPGATTVSTTLAEAFAARKGVCQDFAHVAIGCVRSLGLPARYVSGYLETDPPPGQPKLRGTDASHAWMAVWVPSSGWVDFDPTNDALVGTRHITAAVGRDYGDVPPLNGVIYTDSSTSELDVEVDVERLDEPR